MDIFKLVGRIVIKNEEANQAIDDTTQKAQSLGEVIEGTGGSADTASSKLGSSGKLGSASVWMGNMFTKLTEKGIAFGKFIGKTGFGFDASMEAYRNQFQALIGDADKAHKLVDDIQLLAKVSPLGMEGLANNAVSLLNSGTELAEIIPTLEMLGNLSLGDTNKMNSIVRAYTQILSKGQLMAQEMYQLGDAGVPIREIMTQYGGPAYADGEWYAKKMKDPTYKIMAEDMVTAFQAATAEGGKWHDYMFKMMDTWLGQTDRMGEEGKESLGAFMNPFFEMAKSNVLPRLSESLAGFGTWVSENQGTLEKMADATGKMVTGGFDMMINVFTWMMENGEATKTAIMGIATALAIGAVAAHPYATAVAAVAAGLALLTAHENKVKGGEILAKYSEADLQTLQEYVDAMKAANEAEKEMINSGYDLDATERFHAANDAKDAAEARAKAVKGMVDDYYAYIKANGVGKGDDIYLDVPLKVADDAEASMQGEVDGMNIESLVKMVGDTSGLYAAVNATNLTAHVNLQPSSVGVGSRWINSLLPGHASGLDDVPYDNYIARLHKGEAVLNSTNAEAWRSGGMGSTGRLEAMMSQLLTLTQQMVSNTAGGKQVVLDSGVLVGQLAPALDTQLGTISNRKGRRN